MKGFFIMIALVSLIHVNASGLYPLGGISKCINVWDEGCNNGGMNGAGRDDDFINGDFSPGKRCVNMWDEGCSNGQLPDAGRDDDYINGGFTPGKRCVGDNCNGRKSDQRKYENFDRQSMFRLLAKIHRNQQ
ncbi:uncharacterized protein LOC116773930 [Danaus plexippus]|uniref:uncharacterized protein LOC116773930 n=1 Tax=Danaus plexippus TaxID=13037 RepID=UPI002AB023C5|nr:uncharacterized protein LOC116773930 [Danaus plexippus]